MEMATVTSITPPAANEGPDDTTFPSNYWPTRTPAGYVDPADNMREVAAALLLATMGARQDAKDGPHYGDLSRGLEWLAQTMFHMALQYQEHGDKAGKAGAA